MLWKLLLSCRENSYLLVIYRVKTYWVTQPAVLTVDFDPCWMEWTQTTWSLVVCATWNEVLASVIWGDWTRVVLFCCILCCLLFRCSLCIFLYCFVCQYQSSDWLWRPPPKWPRLCRCLCPSVEPHQTIDWPHLTVMYSWLTHISNRFRSESVRVCAHLCTSSFSTLFLRRCSVIYSVSQKNPPIRFSEIFSQTVGFLINFYIPIIRSFLH